MSTRDHSSQALAARNRALVLDYFATMNGAGSGRALPDFFAADVVWHLPQSNPMLPNPRRGHAAVMELMASGVGVYRAGSLRIDLQRVLADEAGAVAQFTLSAVLANGNDYANHYLFLFSIANDRIDGVWETLDTLYQWRQGAFEA
jgi:ketosteroid isomerase-like protein